MIKGLGTVVCFLWIFSSSTSAQSVDRTVNRAVYSEDIVSANGCIPNLGDGSYDEPVTALDDTQQAKLRIELLERGWDPGFNPDAVDADAKLAEAIRGLQADFSLPVTGQADFATLHLLSLPIEKSSDRGI